MYVDKMYIRSVNVKEICKNYKRMDLWNDIYHCAEWYDGEMELFDDWIEIHSIHEMIPNNDVLSKDYEIFNCILVTIVFDYKDYIIYTS